MNKIQPISVSCKWATREFITEGRKEFLEALRKKQSIERDIHDAADGFKDLDKKINNPSTVMDDYKHMFEEAKSLFRKGIKKWLIASGESDNLEKDVEFYLNEIINYPGLKVNKDIEKYIDRNEDYDDENDWSEETLDKYVNTPDSKQYTSKDLSRLSRAINDNNFEDYLKELQ